MDGVPEIGRCVGCGSPGRLRDGACSRCVGLFGPRCGPIMRRIRESPRFRELCFEGLRSDRARERFVEMFGDPRPGATDAGKAAASAPGKA